MGATVSAVERALIEALAQRRVLTETQAPSFYRPPPRELLPPYVSALEQLLYQLMAANRATSPESLWNERGFFETYFGLVEAWPNAPESARLIAICGTVAAALYKSAVFEPYRKIVLKWIEEAAPGSLIAQLAPAVCKRLGESDRYHALMPRAPLAGDTRYLAWLERVKTSD